jgi:uridine monophosphate synthetase
MKSHKIGRGEKMSKLEVAEIPDEWEPAAVGLWEAGAIKGRSRSSKGEGFRLKLHEKYPDAPLSPVYVDLRLLPSFPILLEEVANVYVDMIMELEERGGISDLILIAGIPVAAIPIATLVSQKLDIPMIIPRVDVKTHGSGAKVDGIFEPGQTALLVDDIVTRFDSKREAAEILRFVGLEVKDVVVLIDREQGGAEGAREAGIRLHSAFTLRQLLAYYWTTGLMTAGMYDEIMAYLDLGQ